MKHLRALLNRIKELDENRTPGEWLYFNSNGVHRISLERLDTFQTRICDMISPGVRGDQTEKDAQFIATLANECAKLVKIIEVQSDALKFYEKRYLTINYLRDDNGKEYTQDITHIFNGPARSALEQAEKIAEGSGNVDNA